MSSYTLRQLAAFNKHAHSMDRAEMLACMPFSMATSDKLKSGDVVGCFHDYGDVVEEDLHRYLGNFLKQEGLDEDNGPRYTLGQLAWIGAVGMFSDGLQKAVIEMGESNVVAQTFALSAKAAGRNVIKFWELEQQILDAEVHEYFHSVLKSYPENWPGKTSSPEQPSSREAASVVYELPAGQFKDWDGKKEWTGYKAENYQPTARQQLIIAVVREALNSGLYYTQEVLEFCAKAVKLTPEQAAVGKGKVEGGAFGMDCYYARGYIEAQAGHQADRAAWNDLRPFVGQVLGALVFSDGKRTTGMTVGVVNAEDRQITVSGKRGAQRVNSTWCSAVVISQCMNRAFELGYRKDKFQDFVAHAARERTSSQECSGPSP
jgi:hypothetical protein